MPYDGERAGYPPLERLVNSPQVRELLARARAWQQNSPDHPIEIQDAPSVEGSLPDLVIAFDSSWQETPAGALQKSVYPSAQIGYITISAVLIKMTDLNKASQNRPMDPVKYRATQTQNTTAIALPGANIITGNNASARTSFRSELYGLLANAPNGEDTESLLSSYEHLIRNHTQATTCPYATSDRRSSGQDLCQLSVAGETIPRFRIQAGVSKCPCSAQFPVWSTDASRIHERFMDDGSNGNQFGAVAQMLERLELLRYLRLIEDNESFLAQAHRIAFISDGQLALFGGPAWIAKALEKEIQRINAKVRNHTGQDMLILAVEKSGRFVDHFELIDKTADPGIQRFSARQIFMPTNDYITSRIAPNETDRLYGSATHFGRKFFYKADNGYRLVTTTAFLNQKQSDLTINDLSLYPELGRACALLDRLTSSQSPNSLMPIRLAHHAAAIPIRPSASVLQSLAEDLMPNEHGGNANV